MGVGGKRSFQGPPRPPPFLHFLLPPPLLRLLSSAVAREGEEAASDWSFSLPSTSPFRDSPTFSSKKCVSDASTVKAVSHTHRQQLGFHSLTPFKQKKVNFPPPDFAELEKQQQKEKKEGGGSLAGSSLHCMCPPSFPPFRPHRTDGRAGLFLPSTNSPFQSYFCALPFACVQAGMGASRRRS